MSFPHRRVTRLLAVTGVALLLGATAYQSTRYHIATTYTLGGDGSWDYLALDTVNHHLFIARENRFMVVDPATGKLITEIPGMSRAHGVAFAYDAGHGFATSGADSTVTMFDLKTLKVLGTTIAAVDDDALLYDPATRRVYTFNGDAHSASVIDPVSGKRVGTIDLGAKPESGVTTNDGKLYVNLEEEGKIAEVDARAMKVTRTWSLAPCESPTGMALDAAHHRLFSACRSKVMAVSDPVAGKLVTTVPIGGAVDGAAFDPATQLAFAPNGDGTLTVIHEDTPDKFSVVQTLETMPGARTMTLDYATHTLYTASAKFGPVPEGQRTASSAGSPGDVRAAGDPAVATARQGGPRTVVAPSRARRPSVRIRRRDPRATLRGPSGRVASPVSRPLSCDLPEPASRLASVSRTAPARDPHDGGSRTVVRRREDHHAGPSPRPALPRGGRRRAVPPAVARVGAALRADGPPRAPRPQEPDREGARVRRRHRPQGHGPHARRRSPGHRRLLSQGRRRSTRRSSRARPTTSTTGTCATARPAT